MEGLKEGSGHYCAAIEQEDLNKEAEAKGGTQNKGQIG